MNAPLKQRLQDDMKAALRSQDKSRLAVIRMILAAIKQIEVDERIELDDMRIRLTLETMIKQRLDSIKQYREAGRDDLVTQECFEVDIIKTYLPEPLSEKELESILSEAIQQTGATSIKDMSKVIDELKLKCQGRAADIAALSIKVKERLS